LKTQITSDGAIIQSLSVVVLCRDNEAYLPLLFHMLESLEQKYAVEFEYVFIENGSVDRTVALIRQFLAPRKGLLTDIDNSAELDQLPRTNRLARLRNQAKTLISKDSQWSLLIDTDIIFGDHVLAALFNHIKADPTIGMLGAFGIEIRQSPQSQQWLSKNHYYDSFAFIDLNDGFYWPYCAFDSCQHCGDFVPPRWHRGQTLEVKSAFGGLALIRSDLLRDARLLWNSPLQDDPPCEHIAFCTSLRELTPFKVAIATDCEVYWDTTHMPRALE